MADDPKGPGSTFTGSVDKLTASQKKGTTATKGYTTALEKQEEALRASNQLLLPAADSLSNLDRRSREAAKGSETLTDAIKEQYLALRTAYKEYTSLNGMMRSAGNEVGTYTKKLAGLASVQSHYKVQLDLIRDAQDANTRSMLNHTGAIEKASANMQRYHDNIKKSHFHSAKMVSKYNVSIEESKKVHSELRAKFITQMGAYKDLDKTSQHLAESTIVLSKSFGVDASTAIGFMHDRMMVTNKTLKEVEKETFLVAKAVDRYTKSLNENGKEALRTAKFTKQQLVKAIQDANKEFRVGHFDAAAYSAMLGPLATKFQKEMRATNTETQLFTQGVAKMMSTLQDADLGNLFSIQAAGDLLRDMEGNMDKLDKETQIRLKNRLEMMRSQGMSEVQQLRGAIEATRGSAFMQEAVMRKMMQVGSPEVRARLMEEAGLKGATATSFMAKEFGEGGEGFEGFRQAEKDRKSGTKEAEKQRNKLAELAEAAMAPTSPATKLTLKIYNTLTSLETFLKYSQGAMLALLAVRSAVGAVRALRGGPGMLGGGARVATAPVTSSVASTAAGTIGSAAKTGRVARAGQWAKGVGGKASGLVRGAGAAGVGKALGGIGVALTVGHGVMAAYQKKGGAQDRMQAGGEAVLGDLSMGLYGGAEKRLVGAQSAAMQRKMGKDRSLSRMIAEGGGDIGAAPWYLKPTAVSMKAGSLALRGGMRGLGKITGGALGRSDKEQEILNEMDRVRVTRRAAISKDEAKQFYEYKELLIKANTARAKLTDEEKKQLKAAKKYTKMYARWMKLREEGFKKSKAESKEAQYTETMEAAAGISKGQFAHIEDPKKRTHAIMEELLQKSGRLINIKGGKEAILRMLAGKGGATAASKGAGLAVRKKLQELGIDEEYAKTLAPQMIERFRTGARMEQGQGTKKELAVWKQVQEAREKKGLTPDSFATTEEFMRRMGKKTGALRAGSQVQLSTDVQGVTGDTGMAQQGKWDASAGTMTYNIVTPLKIEVKDLAAATANETVKADLSNNNSPGG